MLSDVKDKRVLRFRRKMPVEQGIRGTAMDDISTQNFVFTLAAGEGLHTTASTL